MDERERQYREYLALRQKSREKELNKYPDTNGQNTRCQRDDKYGEYFGTNINRSRPRHTPVEKTPYGTSTFRENQIRREEKKKKIASNSAYIKSTRAANKARERYDRRREKLFRKKRAGNKKKGKLFGFSALSLAVIGLTAVLIIMIVTMIGIAASVKNIPIDEDAIAINPVVADQLEDYHNIAVLGIDARADEDDAYSRSDAIIVVSINKKTSEVKMFSVYRDTYLNIGEDSYDKITHAYYFGGAEQSLYALNKNLDLNISDVVVINWKTVADTIDSVGGIEIDVQQSEIAEMNKYIPNTAKNVDGPSDLIEAAGKQRLNGVQAVTYSRIRKDAATGDYRRNERMKIVFAETFREVKEAGIFKMFRVAKNIAPETRTDMSTADLVGLLIKFKSYEITDDSTGFPYEVGSWTGRGAAGTAWFGPPKNLSKNVSRLHEEFFDQTLYVPTDTVKNISNEIAYRTGIN